MHPSVRDVLRYFRFDHLPPRLQAVSRDYAVTAVKLASSGGGAESTVGLRHLLQAKDAAVRAAISSDPQDDVDKLIASINGISPPPERGLHLAALRLRGGDVEIFWAAPMTDIPVSDFVGVGALTNEELISRGVARILEQPDAST